MRATYFTLIIVAFNLYGVLQLAVNNFLELCRCVGLSSGIGRAYEVLTSRQWRVGNQFIKVILKMLNVTPMH